MTEADLDALGAAAGRRTRALVWGFYGVSLALAVVLVVAFGPLGLVPFGVWMLAWLVEVFEMSGELELVTNKSPATVRSEFSGPTIPILALNRRVADSVTDLENGFEYVTSALWSSTRTRLEAIEPDASDEAVSIRVYEDDEHVRTVGVSIESVGGRTRVVVSLERRASALLVLLDRLYRPLERRALAAQGYVVVEDGTSPL